MTLHHCVYTANKLINKEHVYRIPAAITPANNLKQRKKISLMNIRLHGYVGLLESERLGKTRQLGQINATVN